MKQVKAKPRQIGVTSKIKVERTRVTGKKAEVIVPIYPSFGIDDIGSCVQYLISEGYWTKSGQKIIASDFDFKGSEEKLIRIIEEQGYELDLKTLVADLWNEIEEACALKRKNRYSTKED